MRRHGTFSCCAQYGGRLDVCEAPATIAVSIDVRVNRRTNSDSIAAAVPTFVYVHPILHEPRARLCP